MDPADLNSSCQELSNGGLGIAVALLVRWQINFLSARIGRPIQLYKKWHQGVWNPSPKRIKILVQQPVSDSLWLSRSYFC